MLEINKAILIQLILVLSVFFPNSAEALTYRVEAWISGKSQLIIQNNTTWWHHLEQSAPGQENGNLPTVINGRSWLPIWPGENPNESCNCVSSICTEITPSLPSEPLAYTLNRIWVRQSVDIVEQPSFDNDYKLIIEFNDKDFKGADRYIIELSATMLSDLPFWEQILYSFIKGFCHIK